MLDDLFFGGRAHAGVIFVDDRTISSNAFGRLTRAVIAFWEDFGDVDWENRIGYLDKPDT